MRHRYKSIACVLVLVCAVLIFTACGGGSTDSVSAERESHAAQTNTDSISAQTETDPHSSTKTDAASSGKLRDNTPVVHVPSAAGKKTIENKRVTIDISNISKGYLMASYHGKAEKLNIQLTGPNGVTYLYFIKKKDTWTAMPLSAGNGTYLIDVYENVNGEVYSSVLSKELNVTLKDQFLPFLYANQYVDFNKKTKAVQLGSELTKNCTSDLEALTAIYNYVVQNISYDEEKAEYVQSDYLPDVDETLKTKKGICFDYAALMCTMLRTQRIPAKLQIGYTNDIYHAWISTYIDGYGWVDGVIRFDGKDWTLMDPTFASSDGSKKTMDYINDSENYDVMYER